MREFTFPNGEVITLRPFSPQVQRLAVEQLAREGETLRQDATVEQIQLWGEEQVRQVIVHYRRPDGTEPLKGLKPAQARRVIRETPGLESVLQVAKQMYEQVAAARKIDLGNFELPED